MAVEVTEEQMVRGPQVPAQALFCQPTKPSPCTHPSSIKPLPGKASAIAPPLTDGTTLGNLAARPSPQLTAEQDAAYNSKLQPRFYQVQFTTVQAHKSLLFPDLSTAENAAEKANVDEDEKPAA